MSTLPADCIFKNMKKQHELFATMLHHLSCVSIVFWIIEATAGTAIYIAVQPILVVALDSGDASAATAGVTVRSTERAR